jgi:hypothetical protein
MMLLDSIKMWNMSYSHLICYSNNIQLVIAIWHSMVEFDQIVKNSIHLNKWILNWNKVLKLSSIWYITIHAILASFFFNNHVHIGGVMVSVPASSAVDHKFEPQLGQTKDYKICSCCFSAKHAALRRKNKDWLARNQNNVSEWSDMSTCGLVSVS